MCNSCSQSLMQRQGEGGSWIPSLADGVPGLEDTARVGVIWS